MIGQAYNQDYSLVTGNAKFLVQFFLHNDSSMIYN